MRKLWIGALGALVLATPAAAQRDFTPTVRGHFDDFTDFRGRGFIPVPNDGQLDSDHWIVEGMSDAPFPSFGDTLDSGDFARGESDGGVGGGGAYGFNVGSTMGRTNYALGAQPTGGDFTPGAFVAAYRNATGADIDATFLEYTLWWLNDQPRSQLVEVCIELDPRPGMDEPRFACLDDLIAFTPLEPDSVGWTPTSFGRGVDFTTVFGEVWPPGGIVRIRFQSADETGGGSRDEIAIDDVGFYQRDVCGNGRVESTEACDEGAGNGATVCGCQESCTFAAVDVECRAAAGACDVAESCDGAGSCGVDVFVAADTECRPSAGLCDVAEACTGDSPLCPADTFVAADTECRASAGACDVAEVCDGDSAACPADGFVAADTECRASAGACDVAEVCDGDSAACPADGFRDGSFVCRSAAGACDVAELCTGAGPACPADAVRPSSFECRASAGACDVAESCDGSTVACPADGFAAATVECRPAAGECDVAELCPGDGVDCPSDAVQPSGFECRAAAGVCDEAESCDGSSVSCPTDMVLADGTACADSDVCNGDEVCMSGSCAAGTALDCDDGDPCTADSCDAVMGCANEPIPGCGDAGMPDGGVDGGVMDDAGMPMDDAGVPMDDAGVDAGADAGPDDDAGAMGFDASVTPDGGSPMFEDDDDGCGCRVPGASPAEGSPTAPLALAGVLGLALLRRRRR